MSYAEKSEMSSWPLKVYATIDPKTFQRIERYIKCKDWANPIEDEYVFYEPSLMFQYVLKFYNISVYWEAE